MPRYRPSKRVLGQYLTAPFDMASSRVGLDGLVHPVKGPGGKVVWVEGPTRAPAPRKLRGLGCGGDCGCSDCSSGEVAVIVSRGFGAVAPGTTPTGALVSAAVSTGVDVGVTAGVSAAGALVAGASLGSVAGPIGTVVGAVAGYLTSKLFGHADYGAVYSQVSNAMELAKAYIAVAGQYPGRVYGWLELQYIWSGLMLYGVWPENYNVHGCLGTKAQPNPPVGVCTEASLQCNISACGTQSWINDLILGSGTKAVQPQIEKANKAGIYNPESVWSSYVEPVWNGPVECSGCVDWFLPKNARSGYSSLVEQLVIDTIDAIEFNANPCLANYYGTIPADWQCGCSSGCKGAPVAAAPAKAPAAATAGGGRAASPAAPAAAAATTSTPAQQQAAAGCTPSSLSGSYLQPGNTGSLCIQGVTFQFGTTPSATGDYPIVINGTVNGAGLDIAYIDGEVVVQNSAGQNYYYDFATGAWEVLSGAFVGSTTSNIPAGYTAVTTDPSGNVVYENAQGVLYEWTGSAMQLYTGQLAGGELATQLQAAIQSDLASGMSLTQATQAAIAALAATGTVVTPEFASGVAQAVQTTAAAPATVAATAPATSSTGEYVGIGIGALALIGLSVWAFSGPKRRRR